MDKQGKTALRVIAGRPIAAPGELMRLETQAALDAAEANDDMLRAMGGLVLAAAFLLIGLFFLVVLVFSLAAP